MDKNEPIGPTGLQLANDLATNPYAWPGGYPRFAIMDDGEAMCHKCVASNKEFIGDAEDGDEWHLHAVSVNWEDGSLYCCHCNARIESAYAEPEEVTGES